ncbi:glutathionylspermidine synthase family protein [Clostridium beijerinckii]|uniref:glutathionylspermidine synthase family protein n=1 Tax=Clostridium beijerinckii TaxID=1520 RepID=UPI00047EB40C|nr:glutathionylspermidine synthase family protein [Clostridium beijerinckii]
MEKQINYTEDVLFNNYMVSSLGEEYVHSQIPFYFDKSTYEKMVLYSEEINRISLNILKNIKEMHSELLNYFDDFMFKEKIFNLKCPISPMFWARYDTFRDADGDIYFAEFNYDKPCGQKEIHLAGKCSFDGNINVSFISNVVKELLKICKEYSMEKEKIDVGFLMDPCHYEELHHSYYFKYILKNTNINIIQVGPNNLSVRDGYVYAYSKFKLTIILRLFPTEFFSEISNINEILNCVDCGNLLLINDPRVIAIQAKSFFAYLWTLVKSDSRLLSIGDKEVIRKCIPYTEILNSDNMQDVINNKDSYVVKSSLGRYSQEVYIGKLYTQEMWENKIKIVSESNKVHVKQELINIKQEYTYAPRNNNMNIPVLAFGNFGVYIMNYKVEGLLVRWSKDLLTNDEYTWMCPIGVKNFPVYISEFNPKNRKEIWNQIIDDSVFRYNFTGAYTNVYEYISLDSLILKESFYKEMLSASNKFCKILKRIYPYIQKQMELLGPILGIPEELYKLVSTSCTTSLCALGRIDFVIDNNGDLKILEFNSETPAGLVEAIGLNSIIKEKLNIKHENPNVNLKEHIKKSFFHILEELKKIKKVKNIAVITSWYYEDIYTSNLIAEILKQLNEYNVIFGNVYDLKVSENKIYLYGDEIDAIYRHYPLDWFSCEDEMKKVIEPLSSGNYLINPGYTLITQSKALFAVVYELVRKKFFSRDDETFILKYIPYTCLEPDDVLSFDYVTKPYLSREGSGVMLSYTEMNKKSDDMVFQNRINIKPLYSNIYSTMKNESKYLFPVIGMYITGDIPSGVFTRMGEFITDKNAMCVATYVE